MATTKGLPTTRTPSAAGAGNDTIYGGLAKDTIWGGAGNDVLYAGNGEGSGTQILSGDDGDDVLLRLWVIGNKQ
ncbi:MAG: hypothetical protein U1D30_06990 [Planctomycetota bacterium]